MKVFVLCIPAIAAFVGFVEMVTGSPFTQTASAWDELQGWQRGLLGVLIVFVAISLFFLGVVLFA